MLQSITKFSNDAVGIEKSLKFLQSTSQIAATIGYLSPDEAAYWTTAKNQAALARRFFRLFKWIDCWTMAYRQYYSLTANQSPSPPRQVSDDEKKRQGKHTAQQQPPQQDSIHLFLAFSKWSLLGLYLFTEMFTTVDAVSGMWRPWAVTTQTEALKFWFYALSVSVILDLYELVFVYPNRTPGPPTSKTPKSESTGEKGSAEAEIEVLDQFTSARAAKRQSLYRQLVIDSCDVLIPGAAVGWLALDPVTVGVAGTISAIAGATDVWLRVNSS